MTAEWGDCLGENTSWLLAALQRLNYERPLPVQRAVLPVVHRALMSSLPMDFCLTAPTGSGKTLCYLLPMLQLLADCKRGVDDTRLRALVLVPTKALGTQVFRELQQLSRGTSIAVESLCEGDSSVKEEAEAIVRTVNVVNSSYPFSSNNDNNNNNSGGGDDISRSTAPHLCYYSRVDVLITTPQRLLRHLDGTPGLFLADLRLLVIDEADQVLSGNFANFVAKVVERFEEEQMTRLGSTGGTRRFLHLTYNLHKMLCSATLSSHIARISEVRLRNCRHFTLDSFGTDIHREDEGEPLNLSNVMQTNGKKRSGSKKKKDGEKGDHEGNNNNSEDEENDPVAALPISRQHLIRTSFALPPRLQEHVVFVEDWYRHAVLLKLIRTIIERQKAANMPAVAAEEDVSLIKKEENENEENNNNNNVKEEVRNENDGEFRALGYRRRRQWPITSPADYPSCDDDAGKRILVFCRTAEEARVLGHFLLSAGVRAVEFTTLSTESERRRALLKSSPDACVVASDALMRGVDVPNVGHVIMYTPPATLAQYVHRAGRTARAMRSGHLHLLLQKCGPSGTRSDGEVAVFKALSAAVSRSQPIRYERHFFMFDQPQNAGPTAPPAAATTATGKSPSEEMVGKDRALLLIEEADEHLKRTQTRLAAHWSSALETNQKAKTAGRKTHAGSNEAMKSALPPGKKGRR